MAEERRARRPKRLVIDASVAISAGETEHPTSRNCRIFLETVMDSPHSVVMTKAIEDEWKNEQKRRPYRWLRQLYSRKKITWLEDEQVARPSLHDQLDKLAQRDKARLAMLEDVHLIEAALASDQIVFSLDHTVRKLFTSICTQIVEISEVMWSDPSRPQENCLAWLNDGAPPDSHRMLGFTGADD